MKVFYEPRVYLVGRPSVNWPAVADMLEHEYGVDGLAGWKHDSEAGGGELLAELMGRVCYGSFGERQGRTNTGDYLDNIIQQGHGSVLEHANWSFVVCRSGRGFTHEMVRHRAGFAFSQESQHFIDYLDPRCEPRVCLPLADKVLGEQCEDAMLAAAVEGLAAYAMAMRQVKEHFPSPPTKGQLKKLACATARQSLPNSIESRLGFTANARAIRHFCEYRGSEANVPEMRLVVQQVLAIMRREAEFIFVDFDDYIGWDGVFATRSSHPKV